MATGNLRSEAMAPQSTRTLDHYFYNVSTFGIFSVHLSQIPFVSLSRSLPFSFPFSPFPQFSCSDFLPISPSSSTTCISHSSPSLFQSPSVPPFTSHLPFHITFHPNHPLSFLTLHAKGLSQVWLLQ